MHMKEYKQQSMSSRTFSSGEVALILIHNVGSQVVLSDVDSQVDVVVVVSVGLQVRQGEVGVERTMEDWVQSLDGGVQAILDATHSFIHGEGAEDSSKMSVRGHRVADSLESI